MFNNNNNKKGYANLFTQSWEAVFGIRRAFSRGTGSVARVYNIIIYTIYYRV